MRRLFPAVAILWAVNVTLADTVSLNNGDKITGTIVELNAKSAVVETPYAGKLTIDRGAIKTMQSEKPVAVTDAAGKQDLYLSPAPGGATWQQTAAYVPPPPPAPPAPATPPRHTSYLNLGPDWQNQFSLGISNTTGNDSTTTFAGDLTLHYTHKPDELVLKFDAAYGLSNGAQTAGLFDQNAVYRHDLQPRLFLYVDDDARYDAIKGISLQATGTAGLGYKIIDGDKFKVDVRGGPGVTYTRDFDGTSNVAPAGEAGIRVQYVFNERVTMTHEDTYVTSLSDLDRWRIHSETALNFKLDLERGLGLKLGFNDDYDAKTSAGRKNNDTRLMLSLTLDF